METTTIDEAKAVMRGLIHTHGIAVACVRVADQYAAPFNTEERETLAGMLLAAFEAGQLDGITITTKAGV